MSSAMETHRGKGAALLLRNQKKEGGMSGGLGKRTGSVVAYKELR
jgi:hypothetical protein